MHPQTIDHYQIGEKLGEGEQGVVFRVTWKSKKGEIRTGALKLLKDTNLKNILAEVGHWARVSSHENVLKFIAANEYNGRVFVVSELATGGNLDEWIQFNRDHTNYFFPPPDYGKDYDQWAEQSTRFETTIAEAIEIFSGVLEGLDHLHSNDIVHRDIKPGNIFLRNRTPLLADFGLARNLELNKSKLLGGTPLYMSPTLIKVLLGYKEKRLTEYERTEMDDLWAAAATFQEMLTGVRPFDNVDSIRDCKPASLPPPISSRFEIFFSKAFNQEESERHSSAREMLDDLSTLELPSNDLLEAEKQSDSWSMTWPPWNRNDDARSRPSIGDVVPTVPNAIVESDSVSITQPGYLGDALTPTSTVDTSPTIPNFHRSGRTVSSVQGGREAENLRFSIFRSAMLSIVLGIAGALAIAAITGVVLILFTSNARNESDEANASNSFVNHSASESTPIAISTVSPTPLLTISQTPMGPITNPSRPPVTRPTRTPERPISDPCLYDNVNCD